MNINEQLSVLTAEVLRDLGRNESADWAMRKAAVKILVEKNHRYANHPDFRELRRELKEEEEAAHEVESIIAQVKEETDSESDDDDSDAGPFKASFTTKNM